MPIIWTWELVIPTSRPAPELTLKRATRGSEVNWQCQENNSPLIGFALLSFRFAYCFFPWCFLLWQSKAKSLGVFSLQCAVAGSFRCPFLLFVLSARFMLLGSIYMGLFSVRTFLFFSLREPPPINTDIQIGQLIYHLCVINTGLIRPILMKKTINKAHVNGFFHKYGLYN
jgi:hypothetical protein